MVLLTCAEGGYVKFVEFVTNKCLGYYGMNDGERKRKKEVGWNEYVLHYLPRQSRMEGAAAVVEDDDYSDRIVLDEKTMLFHQHSAPKKVARGKLEEAELVTDASVFAHSNFSHHYYFCPPACNSHRCLLFTLILINEDAMMERANQSYREKQYEQHHHLQDKATAATTTTTAAASSSSTNVNKNPSWDKYKTTLHKLTQTQAEHNKTSDKLQIMKNLVTWEDYKHLVSELQVKKVECSKLQEKVDSLTRLLEVERTLNQSSYDRTAVPPAVGEDDNSEEEYEEELKSLVDKAKEYDETILQEESKMKNHHGDSVRWH